MMVMELAPELETYEQHRERLIASDLGRWVLVHDSELAGVFDTQDDAIGEGYRRFGNVPFLVKEIEAFDTPEWLSSNLVSL